MLRSYNSDSRSAHVCTVPSSRLVVCLFATVPSRWFNEQAGWHLRSCVPCTYLYGLDGLDIGCVGWVDGKLHDCNGDRERVGFLSDVVEMREDCGFGEQGRRVEVGEEGVARRGGFGVRKGR